MTVDYGGHREGESEMYGCLVLVAMMLACFVTGFVTGVVVGVWLL